MKLWQKPVLKTQCCFVCKVDNGRFLDVILGKVVSAGKDILIVISLAHGARVGGIMLKKRVSYDLVDWNRLLLCFLVVPLLHGETYQVINYLCIMER